MLILCVGPDTFRAQRHAERLEKAYLEKHRSEGGAVERISYGKQALKELEQKAQALSLFESKRYFRTRNLLKELASKDVPALSLCLSRNSKDVIVVSVEDDEPKNGLLTKIEKSTEIIKYSYPHLAGPRFLKWLGEEAAALGATEASKLERIAEAFPGDSWRAWNELMKIKAGGDVATAQSSEHDAYRAIDRILGEEERRRSFLAGAEFAREVMSLLPYQVRSALRVSDGYGRDVHPFMKKKFAKMGLGESEQLHASVVAALLLTRQGYGAEHEAGITLR